jgi:hypothetical protein
MMRFLIVASLIFCVFLLAGCDSSSKQSIPTTPLPTPIRWGGEVLPPDAENITFEEFPGLGRAYYYKLQFSASPGSVARFASTMCEGQLYQGYDPFNSVNTSVPTSNSILVRTWLSLHYSHSPDAPDRMYGNRCVGYRWVGQITVDKTDLNLHVVTVVSEGNNDYSTVDDDVTTEEYVYPGIDSVAPPLHDIEFSEFPFMVIGVQRVDGEYVVMGDTICLETQTMAVYNANFIIGTKYVGPFSGSTVEISVDNYPLPTAYISEVTWKLMLLSDAGTRLPYGRWNYCVSPDLESGMHSMTLNVTTVDGEEHQYSWDFRVE